MALTVLLGVLGIMPIFHPKNRRGDGGFSLLEMLVVLAILGIVLSLAGSRMIGSLESARFARLSDAAMAEILIVRAEAMLSGEPRVIVTHTMSRSDIESVPERYLKAFTLPQGWSVAGAPIQIAPSGICKGSALRITSNKRRIADYQLSAPYCEAVRVAAPA